MINLLNNPTFDNERNVLNADLFVSNLHNTLKAFGFNPKVTYNVYRLVTIYRISWNDDKDYNDIIEYNKEIALALGVPKEELKIDKVSEHTRAYIKIQDGCNQFCSYCIIPYTRGRIRSRDIDEIEEEVTKLVSKGFKEVVLTGIHLTSYGVDNNKGSLLEVIMRLDKIEGLQRIRLGSLEPRVITEEFAKTLSSSKKICQHFHLSLQSGCDTVLKRMNRKYTTQEYYDKCCILRKYFNNPAITTDVIVGFPQETEEEFEATKVFLEKVHFYEMHIFKYSRRKGTVADRMEGQVDEKIKTQRSAILLELENKMSKEYRQQHIGKTEEVLIEEIVSENGKDYFMGFTPDYIRVKIACDTALDNSEYINTIKKVYMKELSDDGIVVTGIFEC